MMQQAKKVVLTITPIYLIYIAFNLELHVLELWDILYNNLKHCLQLRISKQFKRLRLSGYRFLYKEKSNELMYAFKAVKSTLSIFILF